MSSNKLFQDDMGQNDLSSIKKIHFSILSPEKIEKLACVEITESAYHDSNGEPEFNGLFDTRMGVIERGKRCKTCEQDYINCPGHNGLIRLVKPVFNVQYSDIIIKIAKCYCIRCAKLLVNVNHPVVKNIINNTKGKNHERFNQMFKLIYPNSSSKVDRCGTLTGEPGNLFDNGGCGAIQPDKYINNLYYGTNNDVSSVLPELTLQWNNNDGTTKTQGMNADMILSLFKRISENEARTMGFSSEWCLPHWLIIQNVLVTPPSSRPSVRQYNGQRSEDDITNKYSDIIKYNNDLREVLKQGVEKYINPVICLLQYHVNTLINNEDKNYTTSNTRGGRAIKGLMERLKGKEGRIRSNLMGKRVDFSARSVISPDANLKITDLGVPELIAKNLTVPEIVNKYNYSKLLKIVRNGSENYPGAKSIEYIETGKLISITDVNSSSIELNMGDTVNRHLMDDDYVLFNRQPSLHRMSMMAHRVKVMPGRTFRLNTDVCNPYNADFDGDEMNMHVPQSIQTQMELKYLAAVQHHFISPSSNTPIIAPSQDNLLGVFKITSDDIELTQTEATHLLSGTESFNGILPEPEIINGKKVRWTGKQIYSIILPPITLSFGDFTVINGIVTKGQVNKKVSNMIMQAIHSEFGSNETARYINDLQSIISRFLIKTGFSVGVSDMLLHPDLQKKNHERIIKTYEDEVELMRKVHLNILDDKGTGDFASVFETESTKIMNKTDENVIDQTFSKLNNKNNRIKFMVDSGAKGKPLNIKQMMCLLGQQVIEGNRVPIGFTDRTLPHYPRYENGLESRGFIVGNFIEGINPQEFFFHAIAGRIGLIDTAVKTAKSGYLQRRLVKMMEDLKAYHDGSIRDGNNNIIEYCYGADGFDPMKLENQKSKFKFISKEDLLNDYIITENDETTMKDYILAKAITKMKKQYPKWLDRCQIYNKGVQHCLDLIHRELNKLTDEVSDTFKYPSNIPKLISKAKLIYGLENCKVKSNIHFIDVIDRIEQCLDDCKINGERNNVLKILLYDYLSPKKVLRDYRFNNEALEYVCSQIYSDFQKGIVNPGEMVGPVGAQSIGEQSTQMSILRNTLILVSKRTNESTHEVMKIPIGDLVDNIIDNRKEDELIGFPRDEGDMNNVYIRPNSDYYVLTVNKDNRKLQWQRISEFSRHPANGGMVKVTTLSGREITTTLSHSHLENTAAKIVKKNGSELKVGDRIPIVMNNKLISETTSITIPDLNIDFELNNLTGWFFGAYLSEGSINGNQIRIASIKPIVKEKLEEFSNYVGSSSIKEYERGLHTIQGNKLYNGITLTFTSRPIAKFTVSEFGKGSANKFIPSWVFNSNKTFIKHLIRAYIDYDGNVAFSKNKETVRVHSISQQLIKDIAYLLTYFGITTTFGIEKGSKISTSEIYTLKVIRKHVLKYYELIGTDLESNEEKFQTIKTNFDSKVRSADYIDCVSNVGKLLSELAKPLQVEGYSRNFKRYENIDIGRDCLKRKVEYLKQHPNADKLDKDKLALLETHIYNDIIWDKIVKLEYLDDPEELVYDIGVIGNHTFATFDGIITHNTLNSVVFDTELELFENINSSSNIVKIGEYIDNLLNNNKDIIKYIPENRTQYLELDKPIYIDSCDMNGNVSKCKVTAVTKHLPVGDLVKITLNNNTSVIATQQKSFLVYNPNNKKLEVTEGINLKINDLIPFYKNNIKNNYNKCEYLPITKVEYITPSENQYVYDLTVPETLNFGLANGIMMRDTFHTAGTGAKVTAGVPRMEEILSVTSNPKNPSNILYLKPEHMFNKDKAEVIKNDISQIRIGEILKNDPEFYLEPTNKIENVLEEDKSFMKFYEVFAELEDSTKDIKNNPWIIRLEFERKEMINHNVSMSDIHLIMQNEYPDSVLMYADDNSGKLVFRIKMPFETKHEVEDDIRLLKEKVEEIKNVIIKGVDNINGAFLNDVNDTKDKNDYIYINGKKSQNNSKVGDTYTSKKEFVITTNGSNLFELLIRNDIDENRSYSIEPNEMWSIFGIEACKFVIQQQFLKVFSDSGASTNSRHISLLVNKMCHAGEPYAISIYGVSKEDIGPLAKASFERPVDFFKNAALFGEVDELNGVSANIMMGQIPNAGTGSVKCYLDEEALFEGLKRKGLDKLNASTDIDEKELLKEFEQKICVSEEDKIKINMMDVKEDGLNLDMIPTIEVE